MSRDYVVDLADWDILSQEGVLEVAERAAARVAAEWAPTFDPDDLLQEAYVLLATKKDLHKGYEEGLGVLHHRLWSDLTDFARKESRRLHLNVSYDELIEVAYE